MSCQPMGHGNVFYIEDCIRIAEEFPNAYLDTSGIVMPKKIGEAERRAPGKTLFGSDYPCHPYELELSKVTRWSGLDAPEAENVLYQNAMSLLFRQRP